MLSPIKTTHMETLLEKIETFEDICKIANVNPYSVRKIGDKIRLLTKVINDGWIPDRKNKFQRKYVAYFTGKGEFSSTSQVSSEHQDVIEDLDFVFQSHEKAEFAATKFAPLYKQLLTL